MEDGKTAEHVMTEIQNPDGKAENEQKEEQPENAAKEPEAAAPDETAIEPPAPAAPKEEGVADESAKTEASIVKIEDSPAPNPEEQKEPIEDKKAKEDALVEEIKNKDSIDEMNAELDVEIKKE